MESDLAVVGRDPLFGDGGRAQTDAFLRAAAELGRTTQLYYDPHPGLRGPRVTWRRVEAWRAATAGGRVRIPASAQLWVVSTHASDGLPAVQAGRPYACWIGTTVDDEWAGRAPALRQPRRALAGVSLATLRRLERRVLRGADRIYATSEGSRAAVATAAGRDDVGILRIPVDTERLVPATDEAWQHVLALQTVVFVGRGDDPRKNAALLLDAARLLPSVRFVLAGSPPNASVPPNVELLGRVADIGTVLRQGTLFVLPSLQEGFGIVAAEALACGVPVVTTPSGGPESLVRDSGGGAVTHGFAAEELAATIERLLDAPAELAAMRRAGREFVERSHSLEAFTAELAVALA